MIAQLTMTTANSARELADMPREDLFGLYEAVNAELERFAAQQKEGAQK